MGVIWERKYGCAIILISHVAVGVATRDSAGILREQTTSRHQSLRKRNCKLLIQMASMDVCMFIDLHELYHPI